MPERSTGDDPICEASAQINDLIFQLWLATERGGPDYDEFDLTGQQHVVLGLVLALEEPTPSALAAQLGISKGAVSQHLAVLEKDGFIARRRSARDGRVQLIELAERGQEYAAIAARFDDSLVDRYRERLTEDDLGAIVAALQKLKGALID